MSGQKVLQKAAGLSRIAMSVHSSLERLSALTILLVTASLSAIVGCEERHIPI